MKTAVILVGTCGYYYPEWVGPVYPPGTKKEAFLGLYAQRFATVELDYSYYSMPKAERLRMMLAEPGRVSFAIKAHESLTHKVDAGKWREAADAFIRAVEPLREAGRLEAVLFQFPYSFHYEPENRRYLDNLLRSFEGVPAAVEFRNPVWRNDRVIEGLAKRGAALVSVDMPEQGAGNHTAEDAVTSPLAYIRLHGRNKDAWWGHDSSARYDYRYNDSELEAWVDRIKRIAARVERVLVYFNNHPKGQAVDNADMLRKLLWPG